MQKWMVPEQPESSKLFHPSTFLEAFGLGTCPFSEHHVPCSSEAEDKHFSAESDINSVHLCTFSVQYLAAR